MQPSAADVQGHAAVADMGPQPHSIYPPRSATDQEGAACPQRAWYLPGRDCRWDDQDGQQPSLVQGLSQVGEHVDETPAKNPEIKDGKPRSPGTPAWALTTLEGFSVALHHADAQGSPAGPAGPPASQTGPAQNVAGSCPSLLRVTLRMAWGKKGRLGSIPSPLDSPRHTAWPRGEEGPTGVLGADLLVTASAQARKHHLTYWVSHST